ncbi:MAG: class I SAM-dependent methyltransferase [Planctomycetota bacterium]
MTTAEDNASFLRVRFVARLLAARPENVLDVGAGGGAVLASLRAAGIDAEGCEGSAERVADLVAQGFACTLADACELPFEDGSYDWVAMRHVPHHLVDPAAAIGEALRVARTGLLVAEPWFDLDLPSQRVALAAEDWLKVHHRRSGMIHGPNHTAAQLLAFAPSDVEAEIHHLLRLRRRTPESLELDAAPYLDALAVDAPEREQWEEIRQRVATDGLSWNGSVMVVMEKG